MGESLQETPLFEEHKKLGATMVPFGGWNMPVQYTTVVDEHMTTRERVGIFDICHMGEYQVTGPKALEFLQSVMTNDISKLAPKQACYSCMCYDNGTVIDDLFVYNMGDGEYFIVVNACNIEKDFEWLEQHKIDGVELKNISEQTAKIDVQGPQAQATLQKLTGKDLNEIKRFHCDYAAFTGFDTPILVSRTGYTGEDGFELYFNPQETVKMWNALLEAGQEFGIKPCGLGARDTLRVESCYSLYGHEINDRLTPIQAGLGFVVKFDKEADFFGKSVLNDQKEQGTERKLVCFEMVDKAVPREKYDLFIDEKKVGYVTSGTFSPLFKKGIGMGYVNNEHTAVGTSISVSIRDKPYKAVIVQRPIYEYRGGTS